MSDSCGHLLAASEFLGKRLDATRPESERDIPVLVVVVDALDQQFQNAPLLGDLWILGEHRLLCGDSSNPAHVNRLLGSATIQLVNTDPPYNVRVEPRSNNAISTGLSSFKGTTHHQSLDLARHPEKSRPTQKKLRAKDRPLANDFVSDQEFDRLLAVWFGNISRPACG